MTERVFSGDWELSFEWRLSPGGNSGLKYFVTGRNFGRGALGHEYQIIDDDSRDVGINHWKTAAFYEVLSPLDSKPLRPVGQWNRSGIVVKGDTVQHWLNGKKVLEYQLGSATLKAAIAKSKFRDEDVFGTKVAGHILLTDHSDECWFRNIKIRVM